MKGRTSKTALAGAAVAVVLVSGCSSSSKSSTSTTTSGSSATTSASSGSGSTPTGTPYVVGNIGTYSGPYASSSVGGKDALDAWAKYTNAHGGIKGHPVKVIIKDDQASSSLALSEAKELVEQDHVIALVGSLSITEGAWDQYLSTQPVPVIGDDLATDAPGTYANFFPEGTTQSTGYYYALPKVAALQGDTKFAAIYCAEGAACSQIASGQKQDAASAGVNFVYSTAAPATAASYTAECLAAKSSGATAVALLLSTQVAETVAGACETQGFHPQWMQAGNGFAESETSSTTLDDVVGAVPDFPWFASDNQAEQTFQSAMHQYEPQDFSSSSSDGYSEGAAQSWASAEIFAAAAANLTTANPAGTDVEKALYALPSGDTFGGLTPPITYSPSGPQPSVKCFFGIQLKNHQYSTLNGGRTICQS